MKTVLAIAILLSSFMTNAQEESYTWMNGICIYEGEINTQLTNREQLDNIIGLFVNPNSYNQPAFRIQLKDSIYIKPEKVKRELENAIKELENAQLPKASVWDSIRQIRLSQLNRELELKLLGMQAIKNPAILKKDKVTAKSCKKIIAILCSEPSKILSAYKTMYGEEAYQRIINTGYSEKVMAEMASIDFLRYDWWNRASKTIPETNYLGRINQELKVLVLNVKTDCR